MSAPIIISSIALVLSVASLSWQAWSWRRSGPVISVSGSSDSPIFEGRQSDLNYHYVEAVNTGRAAATIEAWGVLRPGNLREVRYEQEDLPAVEPRVMPFRLEPHSSVRWYFRGGEIFQEGNPANFRPFVRVAGNGDRVSKQPFPY